MVNVVPTSPVQHHIKRTLYVNGISVENRIIQLRHYTHERTIAHTNTRAIPAV